MLTLSTFSFPITFQDSYADADYRCGDHLCSYISTFFEPALTLESYKNDYQKDDLLIVEGTINKDWLSGELAQIHENESIGNTVLIEAYTSKNNLYDTLAESKRVEIDTAKGTFKTTVNVGIAYNVAWKIVATYGEDAVQDATYYGCSNCDRIIAIDYACPIIPGDRYYCSAPVSVKGGNDTYQISGQWQPFVTKIENVTIDHDKNSIAMDVALDHPYPIKLRIPRNILDDKDQTGKDSNFVLLVDGKKQPLKELENTSEYRVLALPIQKINNHHLEILGTSTVPEFGSAFIATLAIASVLTGIIAVNRRCNGAHMRRK